MKLLSCWRGYKHLDKSTETSAEIRNKLQAAITVLELLSKDKQVSTGLIERGVKDLQEIVKLLDNL